MCVQLLVWEDPLEKGMATIHVSCLENAMDRGAWWATVVHVVAESDVIAMNTFTEQQEFSYIAGENAK